MVGQNQLAETIKRLAAGVHTEGELTKLLDSNRVLRVKYGIDPTSPHVHLGHTVPLRLLRKFQYFGHQAVIVIGTATARIGDPSGRDSTRACKTNEQIRENAESYVKQISSILDFSKTEIVHNHTWFDQEMLHAWTEKAKKFTVQQLLARDDFAKRLKSGTPIYFHELFYPLIQGWD